jgi:hypothetical protein
MSRLLRKGHSKYFRQDYQKILKIIRSWVIEYVTTHNVQYNYGWRSLVIRKKGYWGQPTGGLSKMNIKKNHGRSYMMRIYNMIKNDRAYTQRVLYNIFYYLTYTAKRTNYYHLDNNVKKLCKKYKLRVSSGTYKAIAGIIRHRIMWDSNGKYMRYASKTWKSARKSIIRTRENSQISKWVRKSKMFKSIYYQMKKYRITVSYTYWRQIWTIVSHSSKWSWSTFTTQYNRLFNKISKRHSKSFLKIFVKYSSHLRRVKPAKCTSQTRTVKKALAKSKTLRKIDAEFRKKGVKGCKRYKALNSIWFVIGRSSKISTSYATRYITRILKTYHITSTTIYTYITQVVTYHIRQVHVYDKKKASARTRMYKLVKGYLKKSATLRLIQAKLRNNRVSKWTRISILYKIWRNVLSKSSKISSRTAKYWIVRYLKEYHVYTTTIITYIERVTIQHITIVHTRANAAAAAAAKKARQWKAFQRSVKTYIKSSSDLQKIYKGLGQYKMTYRDQMYFMNYVYV